MAVVEYDVSVISIYNINAAATKPCSYTACQYSAPAVRVAMIMASVLHLQVMAYHYTTRGTS